MKNFFEDVKDAFKENYLSQKEFDDDKDLQKEEEKAIKEELAEEQKDELKIIIIIGGIILLILLLICSLIFIFRKNISATFNKITNDLIERGEKYLDKDIISENETNTITSNDSSNSSSIYQDTINCKKYYNATYSREYYISNNRNIENLSLANDGTYTRVLGDNATSIGNYIISNNQLILKEESFLGTSSNNITFTISSDCKTITNTKDTTHILKIQ